MLTFFTRDIINRLGLLAGVLEEQRRQRDFLEGGFQLFSLPIKKWKAYQSERNLNELDFIISHVSGVKGGFGVSKKRVRHWLRKLDTVDVPPSIAKQLSLDSTLEFARDIAQRLALWERYRAGVPYHQIGAANGDNLANRELEHKTWHGNWAEAVGWALDIGGSEDLEDWHVETGRASLATLCARILKVSSTARASGIRIAPHRAFSPKRRGDTGANVHREIIVPAAYKLDCLEIDYHMKRGKGRPIPSRWDESALYDAKGRKL